MISQEYGNSRYKDHNVFDKMNTTNDFPIRKPPPPPPSRLPSPLIGEVQCHSGLNKRKQDSINKDPVEQEFKEEPKKSKKNDDSDIGSSSTSSGSDNSDDESKKNDDDIEEFVYLPDDFEDPFSDED